MAGHATRARRALAHLPDHDPALAALALWCTHVDGNGATFTRGDSIHYGPEFPVLPLHEQVGLAGHHILHVALRHSARMQAMAARLGGGFDPAAFNRAADALVNSTLIEAGLGLPRPAVTLEDLGAGGGPAVWDVERLYLHSRGAQPLGGQAETGPQDLFPEPDGADRASAESWQGHLARALAAGRQAGRGIGAARGRLGDLPPSRTPWEVHLRRLVGRAVLATPVPSWRRPRGAWVAMEAAARASGGPVPVFQPGLARAALVPRIAVGLDTSGSVSEGQLALFAAEIAGIARRTGAEVHLLAFDEVVHARQRLDPSRLLADLRRLDLRRDGGTAFGDVIEQAQALAASVAVILTDLDGAFGPAPRLPVIWAVPQPQAHPPPFGRVLSMAR